MKKQIPIEEVYEPFLLQEGFLQKTPRGRIITAAAQKHLGFSISAQNKKFQTHFSIEK